MRGVGAAQKLAEVSPNYSKPFGAQSAARRPFWAHLHAAVGTTTSRGPVRLSARAVRLAGRVPAMWSPDDPRARAPAPGEL